MSPRLLTALGVAALLAGLIANVPASWLASRVQARVPAIEFAGVDGTAFAGRARYLTADGAVLRNVEWRLRPAALGADLTVATDKGRIRATVSPAFDGGMRVTDAGGSASLAWFGRLAGYPQLPVSGDVDAAVDEAAITGNLGVSRIDGDIRLMNSRWELANPPVALGAFAAALSTEGDTLTLRITESDGPLEVSGSAQLTGGNDYLLDLRLRPRAGADRRLRSLLGVLGRPDSGGVYRIRERGRLQAAR